MYKDTHLASIVTVSDSFIV